MMLINNHHQAGTPSIKNIKVTQNSLKCILIRVYSILNSQPSFQISLRKPPDDMTWELLLKVQMTFLFHLNDILSGIVAYSCFGT